MEKIQLTILSFIQLFCEKGDTLELKCLFVCQIIMPAYSYLICLWLIFQ